ncbi:MAG: hypothetical protein KDK45_20755, partial [Leptospiraceae bacterium]|nr:hypothetical protein [Leptospiraceae bacterium]
KEFCNFKNYGKLFFKDLWENFKIKILKTDTAFLTEDISSKDFNFQFYPSKYPSFLAELGLKEIQRWKDTMDKRKRLLNELKILFQNSKFKANILKAYFNPDLEIIPHRFILTGNNLSMYKKKISDFVNTDWFWFNKPIVAANEPLENYGYKKGCCILSEELGYDIINIPCMVTEEEIPILLKSLKKSLA